MDKIMKVDEENRPTCSLEEVTDVPSEKNPKPLSSNVNKDSDEDSGSDSEDDVDDTKLAEQLKTLESELSTNPSNYDLHIQSINLLRRMGELEKLRQARDAMNALFPLTPSMWQEWAKDEASLSTPEAVATIENLYERGVFDYLSVSLWCEYLNYIQQCDPSVRECSPDGITKTRNLFERALTAGGLHIAEGNKIWEAYREFEEAILYTIDDTDHKAKESQVQRIRNLFHRQLSVPLVNLESTLVAYKAWEVEQGSPLNAESCDLDGIAANVVTAYHKAMQMYNVRVEYEGQIVLNMSDGEKLQRFMSVGDPARVQVLYERAIAKFPVSSDLWLGYLRYMDRTLKAGNVLKDVYSRASKNCPWVGEIWVCYLLALERGHAPEKDISAVFERALQCTFSTLEEYLDLFLTRVDGLRRRILSQSEEEGNLDFSLVKETFEYASGYLSPQLKNTNSLLRLYAYWARLELNLGKDTVAARCVWESLLKMCGSMLEAWQGYITMEVELGNIAEARSIYKRCYGKRFAGTGSEDICHSWLRFEREFGTLEDFDHAVQKVTPRLEELQFYKIQQELKPSAITTGLKENPVKKNAYEKRKGGSNITDEQSPAKRKKTTTQTQKREQDMVQHRAPDKAHGDEIDELKDNMQNAASDPVKRMTDSGSGRVKLYTDQCTIFISNLNLKANSEDLRKFFADVGGVVSIRILHDKFTGKSRGLAYVDFSDDEHLAAALAKNKQTFLGKKLSIARSNPKKGKKGGSQDARRGSHASERVNDGGSAPKLNETADDLRKAEVSRPTGSRQSEDVQLKGKNTFAVPRNMVKPLGWSDKQPKCIEEGDEQPKSNDEFRKLFIKG
ncbi:Squamous cell carcinoma antigen recognized by T-cells 3 [Linum perenne]